jgi:hypothetical protein
MGEEHRQPPRRTRRGSPRSSNATRSSWSVAPAGRSRWSPASLASTTPRWATGSARTPSTGVRLKGLTTEERARLGQLEAENARLRMERDLLKRTVAFWVKETSTP